MERQLQERLIKVADEARKNAYCPYSDFPVGASVLTEDGEIFSGANIENASYGLTVCAERVAIFRAVAEGYRKLVALCIVADQDDVFPCGACRQVFAEFADESAEIVIANSNLSRIQIYKLSDLLPHSFKLRK